MSDSESPAHSPEPLLCSSCFADCGLAFDAYRLGFDHESPCPHCGRTDGKKLDKELILDLAYGFFVRGTTIRQAYGAAPVVQFNDHHYGKSDIAVSESLQRDAALIGDAVTCIIHE